VWPISHFMTTKNFYFTFVEICTIVNSTQKSANINYWKKLTYGKHKPLIILAQVFYFLNSCIKIPSMFSTIKSVLIVHHSCKDLWLFGKTIYPKFMQINWIFSPPFIGIGEWQSTSWYKRFAKKFAITKFGSKLTIAKKIFLAFTTAWICKFIAISNGNRIRKILPFFQLIGI